jgi:predicted GNAT superfamily acetyltransferase
VEESARRDLGGAAVVTRSGIDITIRELTSLDDYRACESLQRQVWSMDSDLDVVPLHLLATVQRNGGLLLGAFHGAQLVGFVFGFPGIAADGTQKHCSHMMGVASRYRGFGIGYSLKLAQREFALDQGHVLVTWTYDPLESRNANLNISKLGAFCRAYIRDYYGRMTDGLNVGLPSDRFQVEWRIASDRVRRRLEHGVVRLSGAELPQAIVAGRSSDGLRAPGPLTLDCDAPSLAVEIPSDYQEIKAVDPVLALRWREATRQIFERYFEDGRAVIGFVHEDVRGESRSFYVLGVYEGVEYEAR